MNDIDNEIKRLLNEQVNAELGPRRSPPPFVAPKAAERAQRRWFGAERTPWALPLLAAACVAAVVGGIAVGTSGVLSDGHRTSPGTSGPAPSPSPSHTTTEPNHLTYTTFALGGATLAVPEGWTVGAPSEAEYGTSWCVFPNGTDPDTDSTHCPISFQTLIQPTKSSPGTQPYTWLDVDREGFGIGDPPQYCAPKQPHVEEQTGDRTFGGRAADWRLFDRSCPDGKTFESEQYVVASNPGYGLSASMSDARTHSAMTEIAEYSTLPRQSDQLRLMDRGIVRSTDRGADGVVVSLDRVVLSDAAANPVINYNPTTYRYLVPTSLFDRAHVAVGDRVKLETDGVRVLQFYREDD